MKILVPIDFSKHAEHLVEYALDLANAHGAKLTFAHVHQVLDEYGYDELLSIANDAVLKRLKDLVTSVNEEEIDPSVITLRNVNALPGKGIVLAAKGHNLILMGQTESRGVWRFMLGDTTGQVVEQAQVPVLVVPTGSDYRRPEIMHVLLEGSFPAKKDSAFVRELAKSYGSKIHIHQILDKTQPERDVEGAKAFAGAQDLEYDTSREKEESMKHLTVTVNALSETWLCAFQRRREGWTSAFTRSLTVRLAAIAPMPTLILPIAPTKAEEAADFAKAQPSVR